MLKIGFIDHFLDGWHSENYPGWIREIGKDAYEVAYAYGDIEPDIAGKRSNAQFCEDHGIELLDSIEAVVERSDCLIVLAPNNPETHLRLATKALESGKPTFIDKTFADSVESGQAMFDIARKHGTPMFSSSALRFSAAYQNLPDKAVRQLVSYGGGTPKDYIIHQLEPLIMLLQVGAERALVWGEGSSMTYLLEMSNGVKVTLLQGPDQSFGMSFNYGDEIKTVQADDAFFLRQTAAMLEFFRTGLEGKAVLPATEQETMLIMATRDLLMRALEKQGEWVS